MRFSLCPRCGCEALEKLATHTYCLECGFFPIPKMKTLKRKSGSKAKSFSKFHLLDDLETAYQIAS